MIKDRLVGIWKDPVWSKIISTVIIALATLVFNFFQAKYYDTSFKNVVSFFWTKKVEIWMYAVFCICGFILFILWNNRVKNVLFKYSDETLELDRALYKKITTEFMPTDKMAWIGNNGFSTNPFEAWRVEIFYEVSEEACKADFILLIRNLKELNVSS